MTMFTFRSWIKQFLLLSCCLCFLGVQAAEGKLLTVDQVGGTTSLLPYATFLIDKDGSRDLHAVSSGSLNEQFVHLGKAELLRQSGSIWLRIILIQSPLAATAAVPRIAPPRLLLNLGDIRGKAWIADSPESEELTEITPYSDYLLPEPGLLPVNVFIKLDEIPGLWFSPTIRQDASDTPTFLPPELILPGLLLAACAICFLRSLAERRQWAFWSALFLGCVLVQVVLPLPGLKNDFQLSDLPVLLAPGMALLLLPHVLRTMNFNDDFPILQQIMLYLCSILGVAVCLIPLLPGFAWLTRLFNLWPLLLFPLLPVCLAALAEKKPGALAFTGACVMPLLGAVLAAVAVYKPEISPLAGQGSFWGLAVAGLGLALARIPKPVVNVQDLAADFEKSRLDVTSPKNTSDREALADLSRFSTVPPQEKAFSLNTGSKSLELQVVDGSDADPGRGRQSPEAVTDSGAFMPADNVFAMPSWEETGKVAGVKNNAEGVYASEPQGIPEKSFSISRPAFSGADIPEPDNSVDLQNLAQTPTLEMLAMAALSEQKAAGPEELPVAGKTADGSVAALPDEIKQDIRLVQAENAGTAQSVQEETTVGVQDSYAAKNAVSPAGRVENSSTAESAVSSSEPVQEAASQATASGREPLAGYPVHEKKPEDTIVPAFANFSDSVPETLQGTSRVISLVDDDVSAYYSELDEAQKEPLYRSTPISAENYIFNLNSLVREVYDIIAPPAKKKGLFLSWFVSPAIPHLLEGDAACLRSALVLLLTNAVQSSQEGAVQLTVRKNPGGTESGDLFFCVSDNGSFQRTDSGFFQAWTLAERTGGVFNVEYSSNSGSQITFTAKFNLPAGHSADFHASSEAAKRWETSSAQLIEEENRFNAKEADNHFYDSDTEDELLPVLQEHVVPQPVIPEPAVKAPAKQAPARQEAVQAVSGLSTQVAETKESFAKAGSAASELSVVTEGAAQNIQNSALSQNAEDQVLPVAGEIVRPEVLVSDLSALEKRAVPQEPAPVAQDVAHVLHETKPVLQTVEPEAQETEAMMQAAEIPEVQQIPTAETRIEDALKSAKAAEETPDGEPVPVVGKLEEQHPEHGEVSSSLPRILIADTTISNRRLLGHYLGDLPHEDLDAFTNEEVVNLVREAEISLVIFDADMPEKEITRTIAAIRLEESKHKLPHVAVLALTSNDKQSRRMLDADCDFAICKPVSKEDLQQMVGKAIPALASFSRKFDVELSSGLDEGKKLDPFVEHVLSTGKKKPAPTIRTVGKEVQAQIKTVKTETPTVSNTVVEEKIQALLPAPQIVPSVNKPAEPAAKLPIAVPPAVPSKLPRPAVELTAPGPVIAPQAASKLAEGIGVIKPIFKDTGNQSGLDKEVDILEEALRHATPPTGEPVSIVLPPVTVATDGATGQEKTDKELKPSQIPSKKREIPFDPDPLAEALRDAPVASGTPRAVSLPPVNADLTTAAMITPPKLPVPAATEEEDYPAPTAADEEEMDQTLSALFPKDIPPAFPKSFYRNQSNSEQLMSGNDSSTAAPMILNLSADDVTPHYKSAPGTPLLDLIITDENPADKKPSAGSTAAKVTPQSALPIVETVAHPDIVTSEVLPPKVKPDGLPENQEEPKPGLQPKAAALILQTPPLAARILAEEKKHSASPETAQAPVGELKPEIAKAPVSELKPEVAQALVSEIKPTIQAVPVDKEPGSESANAISAKPDDVKTVVESSKDVPAAGTAVTKKPLIRVSTPTVKITMGKGKAAQPQPDPQKSAPAQSAGAAAKQDVSAKPGQAPAPAPEVKNSAQAQMKEQNFDPFRPRLDPAALKPAQGKGQNQKTVLLDERDPSLIVPPPPSNMRTLAETPAVDFPYFGTSGMEENQLFPVPGIAGECIDIASLPLVPGLIHSLRDAMEDAVSSAKAAKTILVQEASGRLAGRAEVFGLHKLAKVSRCVERAAEADDHEAVMNLIDDLESVTKRYLSGLQECYESFLNIDR